MESDLKGKEETDNKSKFVQLVLGLKNLLKKLKLIGELSTKCETDFTLSITKRLFLKDCKDKNVVFSPSSLRVALSLTAAGADGTTLDELLSFLGFDSVDRLNSSASQLVSTVLSDASSGAGGGPRLCYAGGVWVDKSLTLHPSFKETVTADYKATLASVDFFTKADQVVNEVNLWAQEKTKGLIENLLPHDSVDSSTMLILANALYFKGAWNEKFETSMTKERNFHLLSGTSVKVPFMVSENQQFINSFRGFKVLGLPYKLDEEDNHPFSMYIFLPNAKHGLSALVEQLVSKPGFLESKLPYQKVEVGDFRIPKFEISFDFEASDLLKKLGVVSLFSADANLTKMVDSPDSGDLYVSKIFHKSLIEVNEEGSEAAAASAVICLRGHSWEPERRPTRVDFVADHPFIFLIREDLTGTILFIGQMLNPLAG